MRAAQVATVLLLCSCASPTLKEYEDRVERGRARLASIAKTEYERDRTNQDLLLIYAALAGGEASAEIDRVRGNLGPVATFLVGRSVLCGLPLEKRKIPPPEAAEEALRAMDKAEPTSSLVSLYRLQWLKISTTGDRGFWRDCRSILMEALKRDRWVSPIRSFYLKWFTWLDEHEADALVKANSDLRLGDGHLSEMIWLSRMIAAVLVSPAPPDPLVLEVSKLYQRVCERLQAVTTDPLELQVATLALVILLPARFLGLWRIGDLEGAKAASAALDMHGDRDARASAFSRQFYKRYEAYPLFWRIGLDRMQRAFLPTIVAARRSEYDGKDTTLGFEHESEELIEGFKSLEKGGRDYLKAWWEDLSSPSPILARVLQTAPAEPPPPNALRWALRDRALIENQPFPQDRKTELLNYAFSLGPGSEGSPAGIEIYSWLLKEALLRPESVAMEDLKSLKVGQFDEHLDHLMILQRRGVPLNEAECEDGINSAKDHAYSTAMKGYCQLIAFRAKEDRAAAAAMLPDYEPGRFQDGWAMIGETLRHVTGQDFGYDLDAWRKWLLAPSGN